jgi:hypothetical protein
MAAQAAQARYDAAVQLMQVADVARVLRAVGLADAESERQMQQAGHAYDAATAAWRSLGANPVMGGRRPPPRPRRPATTDPEPANVPVWTP